MYVVKWESSIIDLQIWDKIIIISGRVDTTMERGSPWVIPSWERMVSFPTNNSALLLYMFITGTASGGQGT